MHVFSVVHSPHESNFKTITSKRFSIRDVHHIFKGNQAKYYNFNDRYGDCMFIVGSNKTKVLGIRVLFAIQSEYFNALLFNTFFNSKPIDIDCNNCDEKFKNATFYEPDVSMETFEFIMKYCYGIHDELYITIDNVFEIYYASQKYLINPLSSKCQQFIDSIIVIAAANSTSIKDIIKLYSCAIERDCPTLADKIEKQLIKTLKEMDNTNQMVTFMDFFNELVRHNKLDANLKLTISNHNQHIFEILFYTLLTRKGTRLNQENSKTILISCKNYIFSLPHQLFLKWLVENTLFDFTNQKIYDICVEYCKHFFTRIANAKAYSNTITNAKSGSNKENHNYNHMYNSYNHNNTLDITNCSELSFAGDDVKGMEISMHDNNNCYFNLSRDCDVCGHNTCTFDFDLNFKCWEDMYQELFAPTILMRSRYINSYTIGRKGQEKIILTINAATDYSKHISEIANKIKNGDAQSRLKFVKQLKMFLLLGEEKPYINVVMRTPNLVKTMIKLLNPFYYHNLIINDLVNKEREQKKYVDELSLQILWCIRHLLVYGKSNSCQEIVKMSAIQTIMIVLNTTTNDNVKELCVWLLNYIADKSAEYKHFMLYHKLLQHLTNNWMNFNVYTRQKVFELISTLCCWNKNKQISQIESRYWKEKKLCIKLMSDIIEQKIYGYNYGMMMRCLNIIDSFVYDSPSSVVDNVIECVCNEPKLLDNIALLLKNQVIKYNHIITQLAKKYNINMDEWKKQIHVCHLEFEQNHYNYNYDNMYTSTIVTNKHKMTLIKLKAWNSMNNEFATRLIRILGAILAHSDKQTQMVLNLGFLEFLTPFIQSLCVHSRLYSFWFLSNILAGTSQQIEQVVTNQSLVKAIINTCLYERSSDVYLPALRCVYNLMASHNKDHILIFKNAGCILCLIRFLKSTNEKEISLSLGALESMVLTYTQTSDDDDSIHQVEEIIDELDQWKGLDRLKQLETIESVSDKIRKQSQDLIKMIGC